MPTVSEIDEIKKPPIHYSHSLPRDYRTRTNTAPSALPSNKTSQRGTHVQVNSSLMYCSCIVKPVAQVKPEQQVPRQMPAMTSTDYPDNSTSVPSLQFSTVQRAESTKVRTLRSQSTPEVPNEPDSLTLAEKPRARSSLPLKPSPLLYSSASPPPRPANRRFNHFTKEEFKFNSLPRGFKLEAAKKAFIEGMGTQVMHTSASHISAKSLLLDRANKLLSERECAILRERLQQVSHC